VDIPQDHHKERTKQGEKNKEKCRPIPVELVIPLAAVKRKKKDPHRLQSSLAVSKKDQGGRKKVYFVSEHRGEEKREGKRKGAKKGLFVYAFLHSPLSSGRRKERSHSKKGVGEGLIVQEHVVLSKYFPKTS